MLSREQLERILAALPNVRIAVVGDFCLDAYWYADMTLAELSRETPRFPRPVIREQYTPGGAGNVTANLCALGVSRVLAITVMGEDWRGRILRDELAARGVDLDGVIVSPDRVTAAYVKPVLRGYESEQEDARLDFENRIPLPPVLETEIIARLEKYLPELDALIIADQMARGVISDQVREALNQLAERFPQTLFLTDSRSHIGEFRGMVLKPNRMEALAAVGSTQDPRAADLNTLIAAGQELACRTNRPIYVTLSQEGALLCTPEGWQRLPGIPTPPPIDPVGAGDAFAAALAAGLAAGALPAEAGLLANLAAAVTVKKLNQTGTASPAEIRARYEDAISAWEGQNA
ncbi:MAG TPA: sugar kinase [Anaerolineae bacterium]|nr:sugar kinase [Anaerolineae bacterium]